MNPPDLSPVATGQSAPTLVKPASHAVASVREEPSGKSPVLHLNFLDGIRAVAALLVVFNHVFLHIWPLEYNIVPDRHTLLFTDWLYFCGHFSVVIFIVLSGFCLMLPVVRNNGHLRGGTGDFFKRRIRRILPPYYLALLLSLVLIHFFIGEKTGTHWDRSLPVTPQSLIVRLLLLQDLLGGSQINHVFWSIGLEWHIYFFFPALVFLWRRFGPAPATISALVFGYGIWLVGAKANWPSLFLYFIGLFALGMLGATICFAKEERWISLRNRLPWLPAAAVLLALTAGLSWKFGPSQPRFHYTDLLIGLFALCLIVGTFQANTGALRRFFDWKPLVALGGFSYSLYLVHAPLLQIVWQVALRPLNLGRVPTFWLLLIFGTLASIGGSYLFYLACERPFLNRRSSEKKPALAAS